MSHIITDQELIEELKLRFERSRKAFSDLTTVNLRLREMNRKLEQSERLKSNFLSNIHNEINNPLSAIIGLSNQVVTLAAALPEAAQLASLIHAEAFDLDFQLRNIFMAAELEAGAAQPTPTLLNLEELLQDSLDNFINKAGAKQVRLSGSALVVSEAAQPRISCDSAKLSLIISNLVANAVEFNRAGGSATVNLTALEDGLQLRVEDTGIGILEEDIPRIFDRFSQLDSGSTRMHQGQGLGLSVVKALVELLEGRIEISSRPLEGTTVIVWLPVMHADPGDETLGGGGNLFLFDTDLDEQ
ncbi:MAG: HAMP domain-containing sensor histidine kinase [Trichlorobacter sp.]